MAEELTAQSETLQELIGRFRGVRGGEGGTITSVSSGARRIVAA
jgi:hypothetical protein